MTKGGKTMLSIVFFHSARELPLISEPSDDSLSRISFKAHGENSDDLSTTAHIAVPGKDNFLASALRELLQSIDPFQRNRRPDVSLSRGVFRIS